MNDSHPDDNCTVGNQSLYIVYFCVMTFVFILALPLNLSVIYLFIFKLKFWKSKRNNIFLFNLVLADILLLFCLPVRAYNFVNRVRRSEDNILCRSIVFMLFLNRGASIAFLSVISIDRYLSVVHPGLKNTLKIRKRSIIISVLIWVILPPLTTPTMLNTIECCNSNETEQNQMITVVFRELVFFTQILIPFAILVYCTSGITNRLKMKTVGDTAKLKRAVFLVTCVILVFSICFLPSAVSRTVLLIVKAHELPRAEEITVQVYDGLMCLSYLDCLLDPLVYCLSSTKFKELYISTYLPFLVKKKHQVNH